MLFLDSHTSTMMGLLFNGWPDGQCLFEQDALLVDIFRVIHGQFIAQSNQEATHG